MPSWNIHTGLVEELLRHEDPTRYGIRDVDAYLLGNLVPDIYVGYMVPDVTHTLRYIDTHYGQPTHIPVPEVDRFWEEYIEPEIGRGGVDDIVLGTWAHLLADHHYNQRVRAYNEVHSIPSGEKTRIAKQGDFDRFGHSLGISRTIRPSAAVTAQALRFPQYPITPEDVEATIRADEAIVQASGEPPEEASYQLLPRELIQEVFDRITADTRAGLESYVERVRAAGFDPAAPAPVRPLHRPDLEVFPEPAIRFAEDPQAAAAAKDPRASEAASKE